MSKENEKERQSAYALELVQRVLGENIAIDDEMNEVLSNLEQVGDKKPLPHIRLKVMNQVSNTELIDQLALAEILPQETADLLRVRLAA